MATLPLNAPELTDAKELVGCGRRLAEDRRSAPVRAGPRLGPFAPTAKTPYKEGAMNATPRSLLSLLLAASAFTLFACEGDGGDGGPTADTFITSDTAAPSDTKGPVDTATGDNRAPELERIGDRVAIVGEPLVIVVDAKDPDGDTLTYSVFGALPEGARFDKAAHRFEWTPATAGTTVFLTFVVSDGSEFDRETVRIEVSAQGQANAPEFVQVGDQQLIVGADYQLALQATDADGDRLRYGYDGQLPSGASLNKDSGLFRWRPAADAVGPPHRVAFTVSDGELSDTMTVRFVVTDGGSASDAPPVFTQTPAQNAVVGQALSFTVSATDPNGDALTYALGDGAPSGASLAGATFTWTPAAADAGLTYDVDFSVTDGTFNALMTVKISVTSGQTATCSPDVDEPNGVASEAKPIAVGTVERNICETADAYDVDVHALAVPASTKVVATLAFDGAAGDLDLALMDAAEAFLAVSDGVTSVEEVSWTADAEVTVYLVVTGFGLEPLAMDYTLTVAFDAPEVCVEDAYEDNDTPATAKPLPETEALQICAGDVDYWTLDVGCGQQLEIGMDVAEGSDIDMYLFEHADDEDPIASAATEADFEYLEVASTPTAGAYLLGVIGYPHSSMAGSYSLLTDLSGGCIDDTQAGSARGSALTLGGAAGELSGLAICCSADWFALDLAASDQVIAAAVVSGTAAVSLLALGPDGATQLDSAEPAASVSVGFTAGSAGRYYVVADGSVGSAYGLEWLVEGAAAECTAMSCAQYYVCGDDGSCVVDYCDDDHSCPNGHVCRDSYCVNPCDTDADCRAAYACKAFANGDYCGIVGDRLAGQGCWYHADCQGSMVCVDSACVQL
ncbi:MAG: hypothetical protein CSA66_01400 [Proteobacteria bacterium]|nr:MAG: hypothetical protein CSA66_01400 [Pseudomonadota bacterium]